VSRLKEEPGQNILVFGRAQLVQTLMRHDLVDEYRLVVYPVVLGTGKRLFADGSAKTGLTLVESTPTSSGALHLTYQVARNDAAG
jgi:dihydrofolate reductase